MTSELIAVTYEDENTAKRALDALSHAFHEGRLIHLQGAAAVRRGSEGGRVRVVDVLSSPEPGPLVPRRAFWGLLSGVIYFTPRLWGLIAAFMEALDHPSAELSLTDEFAESAGHALMPSGSALLMIVIGEARWGEMDVVAEFGGEVLRTSFAREDVGSVAQSLEYPWVWAIATAALDQPSA